MAIVGVNFTKLNIEKKQAKAGKINISNNISVKDVKEKDLAPGKEISQNGLKFAFEYVSKYEPKLGNISIEGEVLFIGTKAKIEEILKGWKKDKSIPKEVMTSVINTALTKCNIQALILSQQVNLPPPVPLPKVGGKNQKQA